MSDADRNIEALRELQQIESDCIRFLSDQYPSSSSFEIRLAKMRQIIERISSDDAAIWSQKMSRLRIMFDSIMALESVDCSSASDASNHASNDESARFSPRQGGRNNGNSPSKDDGGNKLLESIFHKLQDVEKAIMKKKFSCRDSNWNVTKRLIELSSLDQEKLDAPFLDRLILQLEKQSESINEILKLAPLPSDKINETLAAIRCLIMKIPSESSETAKQWKRKFEYFKFKYDRLLFSSERENFDCDSLSGNHLAAPSVVAVSEVNENSISVCEDVAKNSTESTPKFDAADQANGEMIEKKTQNGVDFAEVNRRIDDDDRNEINQIRSRIQAAFVRLDPVRKMADIRALRELLLTAAKARRLSEICASHLHSFIYHHALQVFSREMRECYLARKIGHANLNTLIRFLRDVITVNNPLEIDSNRSNSANEVELKCSFCKCFGHDATDCRRISNQFCFTCFEFGHRAKFCINEAVSPKMVQF